MTEQEMTKWMAETDKLLMERSKLQAETNNYQKKNKWFEFSLMLGVIAATVAITKLFL